MSSTSAAIIDSQDLIKLKCKKCRELLSVFPVYTSPSGYTCGRCPRPQELNTARATTFETLAKYVKFPCTFYDVGCKVVLRFEDVLLHEINCPAAPGIIVKCPLCDWSIKNCNIDTHLAQKHPSPMTSFPINVNISQRNYTSSFNLVVRNDYGGPYVLSIEANPESNCDIILYSFTQPSKELRYTVDAITSDSRHLKTSLGAPRKVAPCRINACRKDLESFFIEDWLTKIQSTLRCHNFFFSVNLIRVTGTQRVTVSAAVPAIQPAAEPKPKSDAVKMRHLLLEELECWLCKENLTLPIFNCNVGHSVCSGCKKQLQVCPICQAPYTGSRNFALESLIERIDQLSK